MMQEKEQFTDDAAGPDVYLPAMASKNGVLHRLLARLLGEDEQPRNRRTGI